MIDVYEVRPRKDKCGVDLISDVLPFGRLWYTKPADAVDYAKFFSRAHDAVIRVYDEDGLPGSQAKKDYGGTSSSYSPTSVGGCFGHLYPAAARVKPKL